MKTFKGSLRLHGLGLLLSLGLSLGTRGAEMGKAFATPEEAVSALGAAAISQDTNALRIIFGPAIADIYNPDRVQAANELTDFSNAFSQRKRIARESDFRCVLEVGENDWPFPVPVVQKGGQWFFDIEAGKEELISRRIGRNELDVLRVLRALVEAQREYASRDRDNDQVLEFAQKLSSSPGRTDGLYWPSELNGETSPLGPLIAFAQAEGYSRNPSGADAGQQPFHGYFFKLLKRQGKEAPGGKYDYIINGNMIGGFAFVAWPAVYGESGIMSFIVNQQGQVYQKDLGAATSKLARKMTTYNPDNSWQVSSD